jgi:hypothetical protein
MTTNRTHRQRRVPRALVHRGRPQGCAHVTCGGNRKRSPRSSEHAPAAAREGAGGASRTVEPVEGVVVPVTRTGPRPTTSPDGDSLGRTGTPTASTTTTFVRRVGSAGDNASRRRDCAAGAARALPGCGWQPVLSVRWWRRETTRQGDATVRLAPPAPSPAAAGSWCARRRRRLVPLATTSYERLAVWPPTMHKCARDPALPLALCCRPLCTSVQRWDPTLPRAPRVSSWVHDRAATGAHAV